MTLIVIYDVACPFCGAKVGRPCRVLLGSNPRVLPHPHKLRVEAFRLAKKAQT